MHRLNLFRITYHERIKTQDWNHIDSFEDHYDDIHHVAISIVRGTNRHILHGWTVVASMYQWKKTSTVKNNPHVYRVASEKWTAAVPRKSHVSRDETIDEAGSCPYLTILFLKYTTNRLKQYPIIILTLSLSIF